MCRGSQIIRGSSNPRVTYSNFHPVIIPGKLPKTPIFDGTNEWHKWTKKRCARRSDKGEGNTSLIKTFLSRPPRQLNSCLRGCLYNRALYPIDQNGNDAKTVMVLRAAEKFHDEESRRFTRQSDAGSTEPFAQVNPLVGVRDLTCGCTLSVARCGIS